jgi:2,4-diketo-3-deoxy-L-fuconate hydrolase
MRIGNLGGRAVILNGNLAVDIEQASDGLFDSSPTTLYTRWTEFIEWARSSSQGLNATGSPFDFDSLDTPVPSPRQVFAIGLNYADHAAEANLAIPTDPIVFTKFASSLTGPESTVRVTGDQMDWEAELVVVIGVGGRQIATDTAWDHVAGLTVGQDLSDRTVQWWGPPAQFSLGKSFEGFSPVGPAVVTLDELRTPRTESTGCFKMDRPVRSFSRCPKLFLGSRKLLNCIPAI